MTQNNQTTQQQQPPLPTVNIGAPLVAKGKPSRKGGRLTGSARTKIEDVTFWLKKRFFKSDLSVIGYTLSLYAVGIFFYVLFVYVLPAWLSYPPWDFFTVFLPFWTTICGFLLTVLVLLKINTQKTKTAAEFIDILRYELRRASKNEELTIITPNVNIGQIAYPDGFDVTNKLLFGACKRGVKIRLITLGVKKEYIDTYKPEMESHDKRTFFHDGKDHESPFLTWFLSIYGSHVNDGQLDDVIKFYSELIDCGKFEIVNCKLAFADSFIVGYISEKSAYVGKYYYDPRASSEPEVEGETVDTVGTIEILRDYLVKELADKYKI